MSWEGGDMQKAIEDILKNVLSERKAAETYNVKTSMLKRSVGLVTHGPSTKGKGLRSSVITVCKAPAVQADTPGPSQWRIT